MPQSPKKKDEKKPVNVSRGIVGEAGRIGKLGSARTSYADGTIGMRRGDFNGLDGDRVGSPAEPL
jgi:hypothetical protein